MSKVLKRFKNGQIEVHASVLDSSLEETMRLNVLHEAWYIHLVSELNRRDEKEFSGFLDLLKDNPVMEERTDDVDHTALQQALSDLQARYKRNKTRYIVLLALLLLTLSVLGIVLILVFTQREASNPCANIGPQIVTNQKELDLLNTLDCDTFEEISFRGYSGNGTVSSLKQVANLSIICCGSAGSTSIAFPNLVNASLLVEAKDTACNDSQAFQSRLLALDFPVLQLANEIVLQGVRSMHNISFPKLVNANFITAELCAVVHFLMPSLVQTSTFELSNSIILGSFNLAALETVSVLYMTDVNSEISFQAVNPDIVMRLSYETLLNRVNSFSQENNVTSSFGTSISFDLGSLTTALNVNFRRLFFFANINMTSLQTVSDASFCSLVISDPITFSSLVSARSFRICDTYLLPAEYNFPIATTIEVMEVTNNIQSVALSFPSVLTMRSIHVTQNGNYTMTGLDYLVTVSDMLFEDTAGIPNLTLPMRNIRSLVVDRCDTKIIHLPYWRSGSFAAYSNTELHTINFPSLESTSAFIVFLNPLLTKISLPILEDFSSTIQSSGIFWAIFIYTKISVSLFSSYFVVSDNIILQNLSVPMLRSMAQNSGIDANVKLRTVEFPRVQGNGSLVIMNNLVLENVTLGEYVWGNITIEFNEALCLPPTFPDPSYPLFDNSTCILEGNNLDCDRNVTACTCLAC
eukprot:CFRG0330T1